MSKNILFQDFTKRYNYYIMIGIQFQKKQLKLHNLKTTYKRNVKLT